ncbi:MAG TPA: glycosyltransferase [Kineosporiaceae bacterium]|nr:glycosyltransferase [Kineosporiaceae bacterium]
MGAPVLVVTPWYPGPCTATPLAAAIMQITLAAVHAGGDVTVVHLVPQSAAGDAPAAAGLTVRRVPVELPDVGVRRGADAVDAVARALQERAADLLGSATVAHAHGGSPAAAALARVLPDGARLVVSEHLASLAPLLTDGDGTGDAEATGDGTGASGAPGAPGEAVASSPVAAYRQVLDRAEVVLVPSDDLARRLVRRFRRDGVPGPRVDVLPYLVPRAAVGALAGPDADGTRALPATRWFLLGGAASAGPVVRALAADALAGAATTLTLVGDGDSAPRPEVVQLAERLGVADRLRTCPPEEVLDRLTRADASRAVDLVVGLDPFIAAEPALPVALGAGLPAVIARAPGPEDVLDEVAATGALRLVPPGAGVIGVLEAVADLRRAILERRVRPGSPALPAWRSSPDAGARLLARHYGEALAGGDGGRRAWPRVLIVDLAGAGRGTVGRLGRWVAQIGGEAVVVTAAVPPPCANVPGAVSVDLRPVERAVARPPLRGVRRRLPRRARPGLDHAIAAYRGLRPGPTVVDAALAGPLAPGRGPAPGVDAVVAADPAGADLARRWTGRQEVMPAQPDMLVRHLAGLAPPPAPPGRLPAPPPPPDGTTERS